MGRWVIGLLNEEKRQTLIKKIKIILEKHPSITIEGIEKEYNNDLGRSVMMLMGENGYFIRNPRSYKSWGSIPLSDILEDLNKDDNS